MRADSLGRALARAVELPFRRLGLLVERIRIAVEAEKSHHLALYARRKGRCRRGVGIHTPANDFLPQFHIGSIYYILLYTMPDKVTQKESVNFSRQGARAPIVAIVGHIDHGKSTLLDYIRKSNVTAGEAGGITQHLSAYEAVHKNSTGEHTITFLDTPGHEAFTKMRSRGLEIADVAILVVSSEEGAKPQTLEALKLIDEVKIPYIVAFTKIDKPGSNLEKAKMSMLEHNVFLEGLGGNVPFVAVSGKTGEGIPELLDLILLAAELEGISADFSAPGEGRRDRGACRQQARQHCHAHY